LLFSLTGIVVSAAVIPLCLDRPRKWFGMEFGPGFVVERSPASAEKLAKEDDVQSVLESFESRIRQTDERILSMQRRCLVDGRPITIAHDSSPTSTSIPSRVALVQVEPTAFNDYGAITTFAKRWLYPDDLERPETILRGTPADTTELRIRLTWIAGDGATIGGATSIFKKTAGAWDKNVQVAKCSEVNSLIEKLGRFRVQIGQ
jgi:hypothetical protein